MSHRSCNGQGSINNHDAPFEGEDHRTDCHIAQEKVGMTLPTVYINGDLDSSIPNELNLSSSPISGSTDANTSQHSSTAAPPPSLLDQLSPTLSISSPGSSSEASPRHMSHSASWEISAALLDRLIKLHLEKDEKWVPSGHYPCKPVAQMEEFIADTPLGLSTSRQRALKVLELFIEKKLQGDMGSRGSSPQPRQLQVIEEASFTETSRPASQDFPLASRPVSYIAAVYSGEDSCYDQLSNLLSLALQEGSPEASQSHSAHTAVSADSQSTTIVHTDTEIHKDSGGHIHAHQKISETRRSSDTSLSSILDDGGVDITLNNRKKKSLFVRAKERIRHSLRLARRTTERSDSRSDTEAQIHSTKPRKKAKKKKDKQSDFKELKTFHEHHLTFRTGDGRGQGIDILRDEDSESQNEQLKHGVAVKAKLSKLKRNGKLSSSEGKADNSHNKKKLLEMLKEVERKQKKDVRRSESTRSSDSLFKRLSLGRSVGSSESTKSDVNRHSSFNLPSFLKPKKRPKGEVSSLGVTAAPDTSAPIKTTLLGEVERGKQTPASLHVPMSRVLSMSAGEIPSPDAATSIRPDLTLSQHSRSRSAQDEALHTNGVEVSCPSLRENGSYASGSLPGYTKSQNQNKRHSLGRDMRIVTTKHSRSRETSAASGSPSPRIGRHMPLELIANVVQTREEVSTPERHHRITTVSDVDVQIDRLYPSDAISESDSEMERLIRKPYDMRTQAEKDIILDHVATKLARISHEMENLELATSVGVRSLISARERASRCEPGVTEISTRSATTVDEIGVLLRDRGDFLHVNNPEVAVRFGQAVQMAAYERFEEEANQRIPRGTPELHQIAALFNFSATLVQAYSSTKGLVNSIKENTIRYIEDKFAQYIFTHGGWDSVIEESDCDVD